MDTKKTIVHLLFFLFCSSPLYSQVTYPIPLRSMGMIKAISAADGLKLKDSVSLEYAHAVRNVGRVDGFTVLTQYTFSVLNTFLIKAFLGNEKKATDWLISEKDNLNKVAVTHSSNLKISYCTIYNIISNYLNKEHFNTAAVVFVKNTLLTENRSFNTPDTLYVQTLFNYAMGCNRLNLSGEAIRYLSLADSVSNRFQFKKLNTLILNSLAFVYRDNGRYNKADSVFKKLLSGFATVNDPEYARIMLSRGNLLLQMSDFQEAGNVYQKACEVLERHAMKNSFEYATGIGGVIQAKVLSGQFTAANQIYNINERLVNSFFSNDDFRGEFCGVLSKMYIGLKKYKEAIGYATESVNTLAAAEGEDSKSFLIAMQQLAVAYSELDDKESIARADKAFLFCLAKNPHVDEITYASLIANYINFRYEHWPLTKDDINMLISSNQVFRKAFEENLYDFGGYTIRKFKSGFARNSELLLSLALTAPDDEIVMEAFLDQALFKSAVLKTDAYIPATSSFKELKNKLAADEAVVNFIEFNLLQDRRATDTMLYAAFVITPDTKSPLFISLFNRSDLENIIMNGTKYRSPDLLYASYDGFLSKKMSSYSSKLKQLIWQKILPRLSNRTKKIYISTDGLLNNICMPAMVDEQGYLGDTYQVMSLLDISSIHIKNSPRSLRSFSLFGGIKYNADDKDLQLTLSKYYFEYRENTLTTVNNILKTIKESGNSCQLYTGFAATEKTFYDLQAKKPDVIVISTHGFSYEHQTSDNEKLPFIYSSLNATDRSGLLLANANEAIISKQNGNKNDGILTAYEIANCDFSATKLVVLGACKTGTGRLEPGEGTWGLQRAFKVAGAEYILVSTDIVNPAETNNFLSHFFSVLLDKKKSIDIEGAFMQTQNWFKTTYPGSVEWANWMLVK